jgi:aminoglycoside phosphotransferase
MSQIPGVDAVAPHLLSTEAALGDVRLLTGHSGAVVTLHRGETRSFVRKQAGTAAQNDRLRAQADKQADFHAQGVHCPRILGSGAVDGLFYFDMEFVAGTSIAHQCQTGIIPDRAGLVRFLLSWIAAMRQSETAPLAADAVRAKLVRVQDAALANPVLEAMSLGIKYCTNQLLALDWSGIPQSSCHGDLTLENILHTKTGYCLIDFDVPELSSYYFDIAKIFQDIVGHWHLREMASHSNKQPDYLNAKLAAGNLHAAILPKISATIPEMLPRLRGLVTFNLMRTLPYCHRAATGLYVIERITYILEKRSIWQMP